MLETNLAIIGAGFAGIAAGYAAKEKNLNAIIFESDETWGGLCGNFTVDGESGCKVFLDTRNTTFIKIRTKDTTYYINAPTREETRTVYESIIS